MIVKSELTAHSGGKLALTRHLFPSTKEAAYCEKYVLKNVGDNAVMVEVPYTQSILKTDPAKGVEGEYQIEATV